MPLRKKEVIPYHIARPFRKYYSVLRLRPLAVQKRERQNKPKMTKEISFYSGPEALGRIWIAHRKRKKNTWKRIRN